MGEGDKREGSLSLIHTCTCVCTHSLTYAETGQLVLVTLGAGEFRGFFRMSEI